MVWVLLDAGVEQAGLLCDLAVEFFNLGDEELLLSRRGGLELLLKRSDFALETGYFVGDGLALG